MRRVPFSLSEDALSVMFLGGVDRVHRMVFPYDIVRCQILTLRCTVELVFRAANDLSIFGKLTYKTLEMIQAAQVYDANTLYSIIHEQIYCEG